MTDTRTAGEAAYQQWIAAERKSMAAIGGMSQTEAQLCRAAWNAALAHAAAAPAPEGGEAGERERRLDQGAMERAVEGALSRSMNEDEQWQEMSGPARVVLLTALRWRLFDALRPVPAQEGEGR